MVAWASEVTPGSAFAGAWAGVPTEPRVDLRGAGLSAATTASTAQIESWRTFYLFLVLPS